MLRLGIFVMEIIFGEITLGCLQKFSLGKQERLLFMTSIAFCRIKQCTRVNMEDLITLHHEMGHTVYQIQVCSTVQNYFCIELFCIMYKITSVIINFKK